MKFFKKALPYFICIAVAVVFAITLYLYTKSFSDADAVLEPPVSNDVFETHHNVYPWDSLDSNDTVEIAAQSDTVRQLLYTLGIYNDDVYFSAAKFSYNTSLQMYYAQNIVCYKEEVSIDIAYYFDDFSFHLASIKFNTVSESTEEELESALERYRSILNGSSFSEVRWGVNENIQTSSLFFEIADFIIDGLNMSCEGFSPFYEQDWQLYYSYFLADQRSHVESYIYDGLLWFIADDENESIIIAIDPSQDIAALVSFKRTPNGASD